MLCFSDGRHPFLPLREPFIFSVYDDFREQAHRQGSQHIDKGVLLNKADRDADQQSKHSDSGFYAGEKPE